MDALYQIVLLGSPYYEDELKALLEEVPSIKIVDAKLVHPLYPVLYLYYGRTMKDNDYVGSVNLDFIAKSRMVLPIVKNLGKFREMIPVQLHSINAMRLADKDSLVRLRDYILRFFGLIRGNRKVFISYRRTETEDLAKQLFVQLSLEGFEPFLDTSSVEEGLLFQEELKQQLADSEVFIYLNSPHYMESSYTAEELDIAQRLSLGIVQVVMPGQTNNQGVLCQTVYMADGEVVQDVWVKDIVQRVHEVRAASYAFRKKSILDAIRGIKKIIRWLPKEDLYVSSTGTFRVCTYLPKSMDIHEADVAIEKIDPKMKRTMYYDGQFCKSSWKKHIAWLNKSLPIQTIDIRS